MKQIERKFSCNVESYMGGQIIKHELIEKVSFQVKEDASFEEIQEVAMFEHCVWSIMNNSIDNEIDPTYIDYNSVLKEVRIRTLINQVVFRKELPGTAKPDFVRNEHNNIVGAKGFEIVHFNNCSISILKQYSKKWSNYDYTIEEVYAIEGTPLDEIREVLEKQVSFYDMLPA